MYVEVTHNCSLLLLCFGQACVLKQSYGVGTVGQDKARALSDRIAVGWKSCPLCCKQEYTLGIRLPLVDMHADTCYMEHAPFADESTRFAALSGGRAS